MTSANVNEAKKPKLNQESTHVGNCAESGDDFKFSSEPTLEKM
jgi:hypothetical protein